MAKFTITMKDPDYDKAGDLSDRAACNKLLEKFVEWDEYITVEFDTVQKTARVLTIEETR